MDPEEGLEAVTPEPGEETKLDSRFAATVDAQGDVTMRSSVAGLVNAEGNVIVKQGAAAAIVADGDATISQGGAGVIVSRSVGGESINGAVVVASDVDIRKGWVGLLLTGDAKISEDSRVIIGTREAVIISLGILGGAVGIGFAMVTAARKVAQWRPQLPSLKLPWRD